MTLTGFERRNLKVCVDGHEMPDGASYCGVCGKRLTGVAKRRPNRKLKDESEAERPKFGGTTSVYCPKCKNNHIIPFVAGEYQLCMTGAGIFTADAFVARISPDGRITVREERV